MKYRWCILIAAIVACFLLYGYGRTGEGGDVWAWLGGFIALTAIFSVVIWGIFRSLKNALDYLVNGSISSSDDSKEAKKMENESSQKEEIRQNKEEMKAEKKASTNKVLLWIIGLIVVTAFAWFVWPTAYTTEVNKRDRWIQIVKTNRFTGRTCTKTAAVTGKVYIGKDCR